MGNGTKMIFKETVLYLKNKGLKVDGLGWQSHLRDNEVLSLNKET